jgi:ATP-dependent DNA ligase
VPANQDPSPALRGLWLHEIKHDGFRVIARKDGPRVRLYSRPGNDLTRQFPLIVEALARLRSRSCIIDGEAVACDDNGIASFESHPPAPGRRRRVPVRLRPARAER